MGIKKLTNSIKILLDIIEKFKIHDLRENPNDLPDDERDVVVLYEGFCTTGSYDKTTSQWKVYDHYFEKCIGAFS